MPTQKQKAKTILNEINALKSSFEYYDKYSKNTHSTYRIDERSISANAFIVDLIQATKGLDWLLDKIPGLITKVVPLIEDGIKVILLEYMESIMLNCSITPVINKRMLLEGVHFDLQKIDLMNILKYTPAYSELDENNKLGRYFYFGCGSEYDITKFDDLRNCSDMDVFLWYVKNSPGIRCVWKGDSIPILYGSTIFKYFKINQNVTLPDNRILTVTKYCEKNENGEYISVDGQKIEKSSIVGEPSEITLNNVKSSYSQNRKHGIITLEYNAKSSNLTDAEHRQFYTPIPLTNCLHAFIGNCAPNSEECYPKIESNYYLGKTLLEFDTDLIFSMKFFDTKVLVARLINGLTGCLDNSLTIREDLVKQQFGFVVEKIIESEDVDINDCFFSFSNDEYNDKLRESEYKRIVNNNFESKDETNLTAEDILESLNNLSKDATKEEITTAISSALFKAVSSPKYNNSINYSFNIVDHITKELIYSCVSSLLSPKIYLIIMLNLKILGQDSRGEFNPLMFLDYCRYMMIDMIRGIHSIIMQEVNTILMSVVKELLDMIKPLYIQETYQYYKELIDRCVEYCRLHRNEYDWIPDKVNYADITEDPQLSTNNEC